MAYSKRGDWDAKIQKTDSCWLWLAAKTTAGYGTTTYNGKRTTAHRAIYELLVGPIPDDYVIDHLCRNPSCVNPEHLEPVTQSMNLQRGDGRNAGATSCVNGHAFDDANTHVWTDKRGKPHRRCRTCHRARVLGYYHRDKAVTDVEG